MGTAVPARYDSHADWYDAWSQGAAASVMAAARQTLLELLPDGAGFALDLQCGSGLPGAAVGATGRPVLGVDVSADQVRHEFFTALLRPGLTLDRVVEHGEGPVPPLLGVRLLRTGA